MRKQFKTFFIHWLPNIVLVVGLLLLIRFNLSPLAFALLLVSKWQLLVGGARAWPTNIRDNAVDIIVAISTVAALVLFNGDLPVQLLIAAAYATWLFWLEPLSSSLGVAVQAGICQFSGLTMLFLLGRSLPEFAVIGGAWLVGLAAADHFLRPHPSLAKPIIALVWGLVVAEFSWLLWRWLIFYSLFNGRLLVPQAPIIITIVGYALAAMYLDHIKQKLRKARFVEYVLLTLGLLVVIIFGTNWDTRL